MKRKHKRDVKGFLILHAGVFIYSLSAVFIKLAAGKAPFSFPFFLFWGLAVLFLILYAPVWQASLRRFPLSVAYANRAASVFWTLLFGALIFSETVTPKHFAGTAAVAIGVILVVTGDE